MTREEAKNKVFENREGEIFYEDTYKFIDKIYDDFQSRICENCKFYGAEHEHIAHPNYRTCINTDSFTYMQEPHYTEGCNKFERKAK